MGRRRGGGRTEEEEVEWGTGRPGVGERGFCQVCARASVLSFPSITGALLFLVRRRALPVACQCGRHVQLASAWEIGTQ